MSKKLEGSRMCVEKLQKIILASAMGMALMLAAMGSIKLAFFLQVIVMIMLLVSGLTGFCYITKVLSSAFPLCNDNKKDTK
jgi:hypothetical protein